MPRTISTSAGLGVLIAALAGNATLAAEFSVSGFIRQETSLKLADAENPLTQQGNFFNGVEVPRDASFFAPILGIPPEFLQVPAVRGVESRDNSFNQIATRGEMDIQARFSDQLSGLMRVRGYVDWGLYKDFGDPNFFKTPFYGNRGSLLEIAGENYMFDLPALYLDYNNGPLWLRIGNQQIAWGEAIFFRVLDVPNGLDLRRHLILDWASEEYADERVPAPGVRGSYRVFGDWEIEGFAQKFSPTILPPPNTPYSTIPAAFTVQEKAQFDAVDDSWNFGGRIQGQIGELGVQFIAVRRRNPDGVFRWARSGVNIDLPGVPGSGLVLQETPFSVDPVGGVVSAQEWFTYAAFVRLDGLQGLNAAIDDFQPFTGLIGAFNVGDSRFLGDQQLDLFFQLSGGLRGHIERLYPRETVLGLGLNYVFFGAPGSLLDQLVVRFEGSYTPDKKFTNPTLGRQFIEDGEWAFFLALEKYQRFSQDFPATFIILQWLHRSESDMFGRYLSGMGGTVDRLPTGDKSFNALALAIQQPFPNLIWRFDLAVLYDLKGGALIQPALRWKPVDRWTVEAYVNIIEGSGNDNIMTTLDWADEFGLRLSYLF
ncbi:MAG: DUF1302 family protein [Pseudomonadota bacterium]